MAIHIPVPDDVQIYDKRKALLEQRLGYPVETNATGTEVIVHADETGKQATLIRTRVTEVLQG